MSNEKTRAAAEGALSASTAAAAEARSALGIASGDMESAAAMLRDEVIETRTRLGLSRGDAATQIGVAGKVLSVFENRSNAKPKHLKRIAAWVRDNREVLDDDPVA